MKARLLVAAILLALVAVGYIVGPMVASIVTTVASWGPLAIVSMLVLLVALVYGASQLRSN